jgi:hypothetical protein
MERVIGFEPTTLCLANTASASNSLREFKPLLPALDVM